MSTTDVDPHAKKEALKDQKKGEKKEKIGHVLHAHGLEAKGAAQKEQGHAVYPKEDAKEAGVGAKDKLVGAGKNVVGGAVGNEKLVQEGKAQEKGGEARQEANQ